MPGRLLSIGECMVELSQAGEGLLRPGFAGDTFNTAWYARACLPADWNVDYLTALGDDPMSSEMLTFMENAGIGTDAIRRIPGKTPGLYLITLRNGERTFSYWRDTAAARRLADDADHLRRQIESADIVYFSGITLGILTPEANDTLLSELRRAKAAGKRVAFDPNVRPRLWADRDTMLKTISDGARAATLVLPSFDDETTHFGDRTVNDTIDRYHGLGVEGVVVKNGEHGATLSFGGATSYVPAVQAPEVVDTTSAGDSFNGGFLSRLVRGAAPEDAAEYGAAVASIVIRHHGALISPALLPS
ncbi:MAG: sugar kinase [Alphaproteobacteria bacterium]|uniref:sugar kinase n=1 Tax=Pseudorhizobium pelagicum TaxID=1509405 RepID=UPI001D246ECC|nr:sugar kinase [Alphaproteobacteria bacterium]MBU1548711.1 sugar kinase [Alphaproteobacteria bacterium]MBU2335537.1 sugar kinase [Alphaproteobacteria bacterium]MBU2391068.1 sugar kinase [Alphaproteobacteria bacterium]MDY6960951.1 sugar kinase [Pseudomonadota bacterium]